VIVEPLGVPNDMVEKSLKQAFSGKEIAITWKSLSELSAEEKASAEAIISVKSSLSKEVLSEFSALKVIGVAFTGYGTVDLDYCRENKVQVFNVPAYSTDSVAELVIGLTISILRDIPKGNSLIRSGGWNLGYAGSDLAGKVVGIVGTGCIGIRTAELFKAFRCKLVGWSRTQREEFINLGGSYVDSLEALFEVADIVSIHVPANAHTKGLISKDILAKLRPTSCLINCARGAIIDQAALTEALKENKFRAGIDVFEVEPTPAGEPLLDVSDSHIFTPHIAYKTNEALLRRAEVTVANLRNFVDGKEENRVDNI